MVDDEWRDKRRRGDPGTAMEETWREATGVKEGRGGPGAGVRRGSPGGGKGAE